MSDVYIWRCMICGETYIGGARPKHCPYCGVYESFFERSDCYPIDSNDVEITEAERTDLQLAAEYEMENATHYLALGNFGDNPEKLLPSAYRALAKIELKHHYLFSKLLGVPELTGPLNPVRVADTWEENIALSEEHERMVTKFYREAGERATTRRVRQVFLAFSAVEADHIVVDEYLKSLLDTSLI